MITQDMIQDVVGAQAIGRDGQKIGRVGQVYVDEQNGAPKWATVNTGLFGMNETFVPLDHADVRDHDLRLAVTKDQVKEAPRVDDAGDHLAESEQSRLERYYAAWTGGEAFGDGRRGRDDGMTRSEERLRVGTERTETGRVRLRKYVVTENQQVTVPVSHEEVRVEREPIRDGEHRGRIGDEQQEVTLHAERPVVDKDVEAVERVRLGTETVTEDRTVSEEVRKERIEVDDPQDRIRKDRRT
ncbi:DUF2382 domain-containing protein [Pseudonocardia sp. CA-107938]|uniref:DUF2382 domain-containing protein n=1 Tax=Pseudonocardia sp. CA-107938 TaxID=3240021 RepID=UPI003D8B440A